MLRSCFVFQVTRWAVPYVILARWILHYRRVRRDPRHAPYPTTHVTAAKYRASSFGALVKFCSRNPDVNTLSYDIVSAQHCIPGGHTTGRTSQA